MKKIIVAFGMLLLATFSFGQTKPVKQSVKIPVDQVPLSVRQSLEKDFGTLSDDGYWVAFVESSADGKRTATKPLWYSYNNKKGSEKVEIRFLPNGEISSVRGVEKPNHNASDQKSSDKTGR